eukprot:12320853-Alexandrium_andersonii.AAC.1
MAFCCDARGRRFSGGRGRASRTFRDRHRRLAHGSKKAIAAERKRVYARQVRLQAGTAKETAAPGLPGASGSSRAVLRRP